MLDHIVRDDGVVGILEDLLVGILRYKGVISKCVLDSLFPKEVHKQAGTAAIIENPFRTSKTLALEKPQTVAVADLFGKTEALVLQWIVGVVPGKVGILFTVDGSATCTAPERKNVFLKLADVAGYVPNIQRFRASARMCAEVAPGTA